MISSNVMKTTLLGVDCFFSAETNENGKTFFCLSKKSKENVERSTIMNKAYSFVNNLFSNIKNAFATLNKPTEIKDLNPSVPTFKPNPSSPVDPKIIEEEYGTIDLNNNVLTMKKSAIDVPQFYEHVFNTYVPQGYYLEHYAIMGSYRLFYRDENGVTKSVLTEGRMFEYMIQEDKNTYDKVKAECKVFRIIRPPNCSW